MIKNDKADKDDKYNKADRDDKCKKDGENE